MGLFELLLLILIVCAIGGNTYLGSGWYGPGNVLGFVLLVLLIVLLFRAAHVAV